MSDTDNRVHIGPLQIGIILLALATAGIHLYFVLFDAEINQLFRFLFTGNFLAYVILSAALYLPVGPLSSLRPITRFLLVGLAVVAIAGYLYVGVFDLLGWIDKGIEVVLIVLLLVDAGTSRSSE